MGEGYGGCQVQLAIEKGCIDEPGVSQFGWLGSRLSKLSRKQAGIAYQEAGRIAGSKLAQLVQLDQLELSLAQLSPSLFSVFLLVRVRSARAHARGAFMSTAQLLLNELNQRALIYPPPMRYVRRKITASVDGGPSGGSSVRRPLSEDPRRRQQYFFSCCCRIT